MDKPLTVTNNNHDALRQKLRDYNKYCH